MNDSKKLSLEQEFNLRTFADQVGDLTSEEARGLSIELYRRMMLKDNLYEELLKDYWGISSVPLSA
ncbi:NblA/ycf18 family protein [Pleurocapsales cyanobacterium LEGE 10410]|nr:NblA/ycf18 family protein [Pleurocapsales cyanobacterium LEGE 10410]